MIKAILVDDEVHCLDTLSIQLADYCPEVQIIDRCLSGKSALTSIEKSKPDLVFLDIEMPTMNGFDLLKQFITIPFTVIFTTSYDQYAIKAIRFSALDYLLKPIDPKDLVAAIHRVRSLKLSPTPEQFGMLMTQISNRDNGFQKVAVPTADGYELIPVLEMTHCEADDNYTHIFLKNKKKIIACRTLKEIEEQLMDFNFFIRVHHSYIVNLNEVKRYIRGEGGYLVMNDESTVNVSRSRKDMLMKKLFPGKE